MQALPTMYAGRQMRSLLEAKWAAFFAELGWRWEYEPCAFSGWIPDFVLFGAKQNTYVEVKPITAIDLIVCAEIDRSGCNDEVLLLGLCPDQRSPYHDYPSLGWMREPDWGDGKNYWFWQAAHFHGGIGKELSLGFHPEDGSWSNRITGEYNGDAGSFVCGYNAGAKERVAQAWATAANKVQWRGNKTTSAMPSPETCERHEAERQRQLAEVRRISGKQDE